MSSREVGIGKHQHSHDHVHGEDEHELAHLDQISLDAPLSASGNKDGLNAASGAAITTSGAPPIHPPTPTPAKKAANNSHGHSHSHSHSHGSVREQSRSRLVAALIMLSVFMVVEAVTGFTCHSLALLADAGHMLGDVAGLSLALLAIWFSSKPATPGKTYGYYRSEILAGFLNSLALVGISLFIMYEAYQRLFHSPEIQATPTLIVAVLGLTVNVISLKLLSPSAGQSINAKAAYLEIFSDSLASVGVIFSSLLIMFYRVYFVDALVSGIIALAILPRTWSLLNECMHILMEGTPGHIHLDALRAAMLGTNGVVEVHDVHVWTITSGLDAMSAHVTVGTVIPSTDVLTELTRVAKDDFGIHHTTIQVELAHCTKANEPCNN